MDFDSSDEDDELKINTDYANKYDNWRAKEEHQKLKDRYGDVEDFSSSESSSESEEDEAEFEKTVDKQFLTTLSLLKSRDPRIYEKDVVFFPPEESEGEQPTKKSKKSKPMFLRDYEREMILKNGGQLPKDEKKEELTYDGDDVKESFHRFLQDSDSEEEESDLLTEKRKTENEQAVEREDYIQWLKGNAQKDSEPVEDMKGLKEFWNQPKLESGEAFLRDYLLEKRYLQDGDDGSQLSDGLSDDEKELEQQEMFEHKYNFRFEEPDPEFLPKDKKKEELTYDGDDETHEIQRFPRTMKESMRKKDDRRKRKREEHKERKQQEKDQKREEIKRLKALKRKEILEKLDRLKEITGNAQMGFDNDDVEGDFDPDKYDRRMKELFSNDYYAEAETQKPECNDEIVGNLEEDNSGELHCEDPDFNMDADYNPHEAQTSKKKSRFEEALSRKKPVFDPQEKTFEKYLDEYYGLDFEDIVGGMPVRFRYREVVPNDFGLTVEEILTADDKELNRWCSLKKACQYRSEAEERYDVQAFSKKSQNEALKKKLLSSVYSRAETKEGEEPTKKKKTNQSEPDTSVSDKRLKAYGINPKKYKNKMKYKSKT